MVIVTSVSSRSPRTVGSAGRPDPDDAGGARGVCGEPGPRRPGGARGCGQRLGGGPDHRAAHGPGGGGHCDRYRDPPGAGEGGAAHAEVARDEHTTRYQVTRAFRDGRDELAARQPAGCRGGCRWMRRISGAGASWRRWCPIWIAAAWSRCSTGAVAAASSATCARCRADQAVDRGRRDRPLRRLPPCDPRRAGVGGIVCEPFHLVRGAHTALDSIRRQRQRYHAGRHPKGARRSGHSAPPGGRSRTLPATRIDARPGGAALRAFPRSGARVDTSERSR